MPTEPTISLEFAIQLEDRQLEETLGNIDPNDTAALDEARSNYAEAKIALQQIYCD